MTTTLSIRLDSTRREKLRRKAKALGKTESAFMREILDREISSEPMGVRLKGLAGALSSKGIKMDGWRKAIKERNWRP